LRRLTRRRAAIADETPPGPPAASEPVDAAVVSLDERSPLSEAERAREEELRRRRRDLPAGVDAERLDAVAGESARRSAVRRRVRYLRSARELLLRDLGGFYYEVHRAAGAPHAGHRGVLEAKAARLAAIDEELATLEARLGVTGRPQTVVREPGVGGTCPSCGELHGSDAGWCAHCGTPLSERARRLRRQEADRTTERDAPSGPGPAAEPVVTPAEPRS
jgi:ribosomal protein L37E